MQILMDFRMIATGLHGHGAADQRKAVAWKTTIYLGAGSLVLLAGLAWLVLEYSGGGKLTFDLNALRAQAASTPLPVEKQGIIFFILLLEASGYMTRAAFVMDRMMAGMPSAVTASDCQHRSARESCAPKMPFKICGVKMAVP